MVWLLSILVERNNKNESISSTAEIQINNSTNNILTREVVRRKNKHIKLFAHPICFQIYTYFISIYKCILILIAEKVGNTSKEYTYTAPR